VQANTKKHPRSAATAAEHKEIKLIPAQLEHLNAIVEIEKRCFNIDRMSKRSFKRMIQVGNCDFILAQVDNDIAGYVLVLYHRGTHLARIYSIAVLPEYRGLSLGQQMLQRAESVAAARLCIYMRLEVHPQNQGAIALYTRNQYRQFGVYRDYYEDHADALRFQKRILYRNDQLNLISIPYVEQTTEFTCGPASLLMAMQSINPQIVTDRTAEMQIWREATTIFMTSGHGGCSPLGLALAAHRRGFRVEAYINSRNPLFLDGVRNEEKKKVMELVHKDFLSQVKQNNIKLIYKDIPIEKLASAIHSGGIPLVLISSYHFNRSKSPHWVVISGVDDTFFYIHDPEVDEESFRSATDNVYLPIARDTFNRAFRFGLSGLRTAIIIYPKTSDADD